MKVRNGIRVISKGAFGALLGALSLPSVGCGSYPQDQPEESVESQSSALTGTWTVLTNAPPAFLDNCNLLTNGDVMCHQYGSNTWHRLTPDAFGSYRNGTWNVKPIAPMPNGNDPSFGCVNCAYAPVYFASAVLPDGRVIVIGGEYVSGFGGFPETNIGFIYDPVANTWSSQLTEQFGGGNMGDVSGMVLQDGTFIVAERATTNLESLNATTGVFTKKNPTGKLDSNSEETWNILYDGSLLTVDSGIASKFERYTPGTNTWGNSGNTPVNMAGIGVDGSSFEVGPCALRPDNKLMCFSGNELGKNALYDPTANTWSHTSSMDFPLFSGVNHFAVADGPCAALPNGNILVMASVTSTASSPWSPPSHFYEMSLTNTLTQVSETPNAPIFVSYQGRMLVLPTGEVLLTAYDQSATQDVMLYSNGGAPAASSRPSITANPSTIAAGGTYNISGHLFNGFSLGANYGDDAQSATNYPIVRITNTATGHVYYARTFNHSRMGVERTGSTSTQTTTFQVPTSFENGPATIEVVANGIASLPVSVNSKFTALSLINGWSNAPFFTETAAYSVVNGIVQLKGAINTTGPNAFPFTLPVGARPSTTVYVPADLVTANTGRLVINSTGIVSVGDEGGGFVNAPQFTSLENVSFAINSTGFTALTLINGWTNAPFSTRNAAVKNDNGLIRFEGAIATSGTNQSPFTLPSGFRPPTEVYVPIGLCNATKGRLHIVPSGAVTVEVENFDWSQAQCFTSLEGATFALSASGYTSATLQNGWVNAPFGTRNVAFKNDDGILRLQGAVGSGSSGVIFTLPGNLRPARTVYVNVDLCSAHKGRIYALTDGTVTVQPQNLFSDAQCFTSLEGVSFGFGI